MPSRIALHDLDTANSLLSVLDLQLPPEWFSERYNVAPLSAVWAVTLDTIRPRLIPAQWGLIPPWAKPGQFQRPLTHARAETVWEKASFKSLIRRYRGVVICNGFFLFKGRGEKSEVLYVKSREGALALGVIWQYNADGNTELAVLNTDQGALADTVDRRCPVIVGRDEIDQWLLTDKVDRINSLLLAPIEPDLTICAVKPGVRDPLNEGPICIEPLDNP